MGLVNSCFKGDDQAGLGDKDGSPGETGAVKQYSWDQTRAQKDISKYIIENIHQGEVGRMPGDVNGEQIVIRNCENANIYIFDHTNTVSIDDCRKCEIFIGPTKSSLFIRDCSDCTLVASCGQFRTRDCHGLTAFLCCPTQPIIEATTKAKFGCFQVNYPELADQFQQAGLSRFNNMWWNIHDFTPIHESKNWKLLGECYKVKEFLTQPASKPLNGVTLDFESSPVPYTIGSRSRDHDETSLVLIFADNLQDQRAAKVLAEMDRHTEIELVKTRFLQLQDTDAERIFSSKNYKISCQLGPVIALQFAGPDCIRFCGKVVDSVTISTLGQGKILTSTDSSTASSQINGLFNFIDMQMGL
ncbi:protein XRP2-like [Tigriopus californicus]|uniref:protein XRP2-like n=1 Tax=Tigriopus californicus TaxID=6832 RepID=UPI0027DA89EC|nr:protein XRP2-like [Tigriopus californicus]